MGHRAIAVERLETMLREGAIDAWTNHGSGVKFQVTTVDGYEHIYTPFEVRAFWSGYVSGKRVAHYERDRLDGIAE